MEADTIVAQVTPQGEGGVGIVRVSGPAAPVLPGLLFPTIRGDWRSHSARMGTLVDPTDGAPVDAALGLLMRAPRSYTGEDVFEIQCHGSPLVLERVLRICLHAGCRAARPGEFTLRGFLNGRLDLAQAEAVLDVVRARTNAGLSLAMQQLSGRLSGRVEPLRQTLVGLLAHMEAQVDFVEDDIPPQPDGSLVDRLRETREAVVALLEGAEEGIVLREGATLSIVGSPNVGKSSIMNGLLGLERSIVTPVAGTTRDTVEEMVQLGGVPFRAIDTAGIAETDDPVERIGVDRSRAALAAADIVLVVLDRSRPFSELDGLALAAVRAAVADAGGADRPPRVVVSLNKADLPARLEGRSWEEVGPAAVVESSAVARGGLEGVRAALAQAAIGGERHDVVVASVRHRDALRRCETAVADALGGLATGLPLDLISFDLRAATRALGEITGADVDEELLDRIFRDFCIGK